MTHASTQIGIFGALYFLIILIISLFHRFPISSRKLFFFRALFPSWRFYDEIGARPVLYYRTKDRKSSSPEFGPWILLNQPISRTFFSILFNPQGNYRLACSSLLQHLLTDLEDLDENKNDDLSSRVSYQLVNRWVFEQVRLPATDYQFKIVSALVHSEEDILISPVFSRLEKIDGEKR